MRRYYNFRILTIISACGLLLLCTISLYRPSILGPSSTLSPEDRPPVRIDILETAGAHDEVIAALVYAFGSYPNANLSLFQANSRFGMSEVMSRFHLPQKVPKARHPNEWGGLLVPDILVSTTCTLDFINLKERWGQLDRIGKTHMFCVVHHGDWWDRRPIEQTLTPWIKKGKFNFITLSPHTAAYLRDKGLNGWNAGMKKKLQNGIKILPPVFPVELPPLPGVNASAKEEAAKGTSAGKTKMIAQEELAFALQGNYESTRRNFDSVFADIANLSSISLSPPATHETTQQEKKKPQRRSSNAVKMDSKGRPAMNEQKFRWDDEDATITHNAQKNITLHLLGSGKAPPIPSQLTDHVILNPSLSYPDFYSLLSTAVAIIPAFASPHYLDRKASSSIPAALIAGTPLIASRELMDAYGYLDEDSVYLMKEDGAYGRAEVEERLSGRATVERREIDINANGESTEWVDASLAASSKDHPAKEGGSKPETAGTATNKETRLEVMRRIIALSPDERVEVKRRVRLRCAALAWQNREMVSGEGGWIDEVMGKGRKGRWLGLG